MNRLPGDFRYSIRKLWGRPNFPVSAIAILALGIGLNTAIFSLVNTLLGGYLPGVQQPDRIVRIFSSREYGNGMLSWPAYQIFLNGAKSFSGMAAYLDWAEADLLVPKAGSQRVKATLVSGKYFKVLGVHPQLGRMINDSDMAHSQDVIVLSGPFWSGRFASNPAVLNSNIALNGHTFTIIGVAAKDFRGLNFERVPDIWAPISALSKVMPNAIDWDLNNPMMFWRVVGRLQPGATMAGADSELQVLASSHPDLWTEYEAKPAKKMAVAGVRDGSLDWDLRSSTIQVSWILSFVAVMVLIMSCAVVGGLQLTRAHQRKHEISVRLALGASRFQIVRLLLVESFIISVCAAASGL